MRNHPDFRRIDSGLVRLLRNWFNPVSCSGTNRLVDPCKYPGKIIAYEAVHEITSWDDLRARLALTIGAVSLSFILPCPMSR